MALLVREKLVPCGSYEKEKELEDRLKKSPDLLRDKNGPAIEFVCSQIDLPDGAGRLDLLFVDGNGLPIVVEVKLKDNESRRVVIGQVIDYLSSLTTLTVDELNSLVKGELEKALRKLAGDAEAPATASGDSKEDGDGEDNAPDEDAGDKRFDGLWDAVATNLRAGQAKPVVAVDDAPPELERIFRFLARNSQLNVQLLTVKKHSSEETGDIFVSRTVVNPATEGGTRKPPNPPHQFEEVINAYNQGASEDVRATGTGPTARYIHPPGWPGDQRRGIHYKFWRQRTTISVRLVNMSPGQWGSLADCCAALGTTTVADGRGTLVWRPGQEVEKLYAEFPVAEPPETIAKGMQDLVSQTSDCVTNILNRRGDDPATGLPVPTTPR